MYNIYCDGTHYFIIYKDNEILFKGTHKGQLTTGNGIIEYFDSEALMMARIDTLGLIEVDNGSD